MAINDTINGAHTLVRNGLMQTDMDAQGYRILNLDTSSLVIPGIPSQSSEPHTWFNSYDMGTHLFGYTRPSFSDLSGNLTSSQQSAITRLGTITQGIWRGTRILQAYVPVLSAIAPPTESVNFNNQKIQLLADPVSDQDGVNLRTLIARALGPANPKAAVVAATTAQTPLIGLTIVDGYQTIQGDRILVKDQPPPTHDFQNGIYNASAGAWTRSDDTNTGTEMNAATVFVLGGDTQQGTTWLQTSVLTNPIQSQPIVWVLLSTTLSLDAGDGLDISGNTISAVGTANRISVGVGIDIDVAYEGQGSITTLGIIDTGTWESDVIDGDFGGTGVANIGKTITLAGNLSTTIGVGAPIGSSVNLNLLGVTNLNLPIVGTLATLAGDETFTNKHISASQIDTGILPITRGGTGANTAQAAILNFLPDTAGHAGESLHTDGADVLYWA